MDLEPEAKHVTTAEAPRLQPPLLLAGATAVGKSELALLLAERLNAEIISVDSMQVYRGLDIGTAKPSPEDRARVPHHLIDVVDPGERFDAARFLRLAREAAANIQSRGRVPLLCGGTGLYFKVFLEGLSETPPADPLLRAELEKQPLTQLLEELAQFDPATYARIDRQNPRRVVRAVEVFRLTGRPLSEQRAHWNQPQAGASATPIFGLARAPAELRRRIDARVEDMFRRGLVAETQELLRRGLGENPIAQQALGYRQVIELLRGSRPLDQTVELVKIRTRQFAKRQMTWFRRQLTVSWIHLPSNAAPPAAAAELAEVYLRRSGLRRSPPGEGSQKSQ